MNIANVYIHMWFNYMYMYNVHDMHPQNRCHFQIPCHQSRTIHVHLKAVLGVYLCLCLLVMYMCMVQMKGASIKHVHVP